MNPFDIFDKIYCINLDTRPDRWKSAQDQFDKVEILDRVTRISGIIYSNTSDKHRNACIGNHLSHALCIRDAKENKLNSCLIFEDDIEFFENPKENLHCAVSELPDDWDMFYLGINMDAYYAYQVTTSLAKLTGGFATHAYAIRYTLFDLLIDLNEDTTIAHNDVAYATQIIPNYHCYVSIPLIAGQLDSYSDIEGKVMSSNKMFKERFEQKLIRLENVGR